MTTKILWVNEECDGPMSGVVEHKGEKLWFLRPSSPSFIPVQLQVQEHARKGVLQLYRLDEHSHKVLWENHVAKCKETGDPLNHGDPYTFTTGTKKIEFNHTLPSSPSVEYVTTIAEEELTEMSKLSRLLITGPLDLTTPLCVVLEVAEAHGIVFDPNSHDLARSLIWEITHKIVNRVKFSSEMTGSELQLVARFVNSLHRNWTKRTLQPAFEFLLQFATREKDILSRLPVSFEVGPQTSTNPFSLNACVLFRICKDNDIHLTSGTTLQEMGKAVRLLRCPLSSLVNLTTKLAQSATQSQLINVLLTFKQDFDLDVTQREEKNTNFDVLPKEQLSTDKLYRGFRYFTNLKALQREIGVKTASDCVTVLALSDNFDISRAENPFAELTEFRSKTRDLYCPLDPWMSYWFKINPKLFNLAVTFNPIFPREFYKEEDLVGMLISEGYDPNTVEDVYETLQVAHLSNTFYYGNMPNIKSTSTVIQLDLIGDVPYGELICYGQKETGLEVTSISELIDLFEANKNFSSPFSQDDVFSPEAVNKLKLIARSTEGPGREPLSMETIQLKSKLVSVIDKLLVQTRTQDPKVRDFLFKFSLASEGEREAVLNAFRSLVKLGMFMRGWTGEGDFPLSRDFMSPLSYEEVEKNTCTEIINFECKCEQLEDFGKIILQLPLVIHKSGEYHVSNDSDEGLTIGERVKIVKEGDKAETTNSCIRLSSNWICSSAHKYIMLLGEPAPFDIYHLRHIS